MVVTDVGGHRDPLLLFQEGSGMCSPAVHHRQTKFVAHARGQCAFECKMEILDAVVLESGGMVCIVFGRDDQRGTHGFAELGVAGPVLAIVVVVVSSAATTGVSGMVEIDPVERAALVAGAHVFHDHLFHPFELRECEFHAPQPVRSVPELRAGLVRTDMLVISFRVP